MEVRSVEAIVRALNEAEVEYLIVGGIAVGAHGFCATYEGCGSRAALEPGKCGARLTSLFGIGYALSIPVAPEDFADAATREHWRVEKGMIA